MTRLPTALLSMWLLSCLGCTTKVQVLPADRQTPCLVEGQQPCQRYIIDAGFLRDIMIRLGECKK
jgi:hypothetical protein